jgi:ubiquinone/menaquinone biosynthesis C-methylase UbiE
MKDNTDGQVLKEQYKTTDNLDIRRNLHSYNTNETDWDIWCMDQMRLPYNARILELGCGTGEFWSKNASNLKKDWDITLSDFSTGMIEDTRKRLEGLNCNFTYKEINAEDIPYEDESFDVVIARHMLYLVPDIEKTLSEVQRVLVKGGSFYATTNTHESMAELNKLMEKFDSEIGLHNNRKNQKNFIKMFD